MSLNHRARDNKDLLDAAVASDPQRRMSGVQTRAQRHEPLDPAALGAAAPPSISIGAPADESLLEPTYAYLSAYCTRVFAPRVAERLNVAIYELYANALRYGRGDEVRFQLGRLEGGAWLRVESSAEPSDVARLREQLARVREDAEAAFNREMSRFGSDGQPAPMLGIVRIAHESRLSLELELDGARVAISTRCAD